MQIMGKLSYTFQTNQALRIVYRDKKIEIKELIFFLQAVECAGLPIPDPLHSGIRSLHLWFYSSSTRSFHS